MDLKKFKSLISTESLYFARSDIFTDKFEGSWTNATNQFLENSVQDLSPEIQKNFSAMLRDSSTFKENIKRFVAINCWHANEHESVAMWDIYMKRHSGIAVQTTYSNLKKSIIDSTPVKMGVVTYVDYSKHVMDPGNIFSPYVYKRLSFDHEREIRGVVSRSPKLDEPSDFSGPGLEEGLFIKVNLKVLIENIYVAPNASASALKNVTSFIHKHGFDFNVIPSALDERPFF